ncbi:MAG: hypothetical protein ACMUIE_06815 [Thermoplasmatota archaeon]
MNPIERVQPSGASYRMKGLRLVLASITIDVFLSLFGVLFLVYYQFFFELRPDSIRTSICLVGMVSFGLLIFDVVSLIILGRGLFILKKDSGILSDKHRNNMNWAFRFFWIMVICFAVSFSLGFFTGYIDGTTEFALFRYISLIIIGGTLGWISTISYILALILPLLELSGKRQVQFGSIFGIGFILISLISDLLWSAIYLPVVVLFIIGYMIILAFPLIRIILLVFILLAYKETLAIHGNKEVAKKKILRKEPGIVRSLQVRMGKPMSLLITFTIVGIILSTGSGIGTYIRINEHFISTGPKERTEPEITILEELQSQTWSATGILMEGDNEEMTIDTSGNMIVDISILLVWEDEPDQIWFQNQSEMFTITSFLLNDAFSEKEESGSNPRNGKGRLEISYDLGEGGEFIDMIFVSVILDSSGDYEPRIGPGFFTREDGRNDYNLVVEFNYFAAEEVI